MIKKLDEINAMIDRGGEHLAWLEDFVRHSDNRVVADDPNIYTLEESFDLITCSIRIRIGECANSFRNALNYLTCAIAEQDSGKIGRNVQFPLEETPQLFRGRRNTYLEGIRDERIATFEKFQPYKAGNWLSDLRRLSNFYKHTGLILVEKKIDQIKPHAPARVLPFTVTLPDRRPIIDTLDLIHRGVSDIVNEFNPFVRNIGI